jgi:hypothetical protein
MSMTGNARQLTMLGQRGKATMIEPKKDDLFAAMGRVYVLWLAQNGLSNVTGDAEELVMFDGAEGSGYTLTTAQRRWVTRFIELWLATEVLEKL